jgi:hypothetical protein
LRRIERRETIQETPILNFTLCIRERVAIGDGKGLTMRIGEVSRLAEVPIQTLRCLTRATVFPPSNRLPTNLSIAGGRAGRAHRSPATAPLYLSPAGVRRTWGIHPCAKAPGQAARIPMRNARAWICLVVLLVSFPGSIFVVAPCEVLGRGIRHNKKGRAIWTPSSAATSHPVQFVCNVIVGSMFTCLGGERLSRCAAFLHFRRIGNRVPYTKV